MPDLDPIRYKYTFDDDGKLVSITDPSGRVTTYSRDGASLDSDAAGRADGRGWVPRVVLDPCS
jgi:hypothetical protein